eukprot:11202078-Lingulodinium_polyedra.AAC.1
MLQQTDADADDDANAEHETANAEDNEDSPLHLRVPTIPQRKTEHTEPKRPQQNSGYAFVNTPRTNRPTMFTSCRGG